MSQARLMPSSLLACASSTIATLARPAGHPQSVSPRMNTVCPAATSVVKVEGPDTDGDVATIVYCPGSTSLMIMAPFDKLPTE